MFGVNVAVSLAEGRYLGFMLVWGRVQGFPLETQAPRSEGVGVA